MSVDHSGRLENAPKQLALPNGNVPVLPKGNAAVSPKLKAAETSGFRIVVWSGENAQNNKMALFCANFLKVRALMG